MSDQPSQTALLELTAEIVSAHASNNKVAPAELSEVIKDVFGTLSELGESGAGRSTNACSASQKIDHARSYCVLGRRQKAQNVEAAPKYRVWHDARTVSRAMGLASGLSDGGAQLCETAQLIG